jgi:signal transduction histidine kinase
MAAQSHRRQVLLFLAAILLPCAALTVLGLRLVVQERELAKARLEDEQRRVTRELRQELVSRLERTALRQVTALSAHPELLRARAYEDSTVALVARAANGRLTLPWEQDQAPRDARVLLGRGDFGARIRQGEQAEFGGEGPTEALALYRGALAAATDPVQEAHARLFLARASAKAGREEDAHTLYRRLVTAPPDLVDEHGVPLALYAAWQLLRTGRADPEAADAVLGALSREAWLPPPALYLLRELVDTLARRESDPFRGDKLPGAEEVRRSETLRRAEEALSTELPRTEQALALRRDFPSLGLRVPDAGSGDGGTTWISHGSPAWFVGAAPVADGEDGLVVAVRAGPLLASLEAGTNHTPSGVGALSVTNVPAPGSEPLGAAFPGLFVHFDTPASAFKNQVGSLRWWFYSAGLLLVLGVTLFGAYLLWRDVRREMELAETRSRFVAAVSHELKTPLTAIRMFAETLHEGNVLDAAAQRDYLETIISESERLTRLLNNVLDFSKIEGERKTYRQELQSLEEIVRFAARAMQYPLEQKRFSLHLEIEENVPSAQVDRDSIEQAILNLLANAMKYSGDNRDISLRLRSESGTAVIEVSDRGVGIEPAEVPRIFDRFYRAPSAANDRIPGAGLGLTLVQHIAQAHGGRVGVQSEPGTGSTFSLVLPLDGADA